jgi:hypothetical protein
MRPKLKGTGNRRVKLEHHEVLSKFAFKLNLRRYTTGLGVLAEGYTLAERVAGGCDEHYLWVNAHTWAGWSTSTSPRTRSACMHEQLP